MNIRWLVFLLCFMCSFPTTAANWLITLSDMLLLKRSAKVKDALWTRIISLLLKSTAPGQLTFRGMADSTQGRIQPVNLGGPISVKFCGQVSLRVTTAREMTYTSRYCCDKTMDGKMALYRECYFLNCAKSWCIKLLSLFLGGEIAPTPPPPGSAPDSTYAVCVHILQFDVFLCTSVQATTKLMNTADFNINVYKKCFGRSANLLVASVANSSCA